MFVVSSLNGTENSGGFQSLSLGQEEKQGHWAESQKQEMPGIRSSTLTPNVRTRPCLLYWFGRACEDSGKCCVGKSSNLQGFMFIQWVLVKLISVLE